MAKYRITAPDGNAYDVTAPDSASQDEVLAYAKSNYQKPSEPKTDWKKVVGQSLKDIVQKPLAFAKDLGTNPESMANAMPALVGTAGAISPFPGGATTGTGIGQGIRDAALGTLKKPIPGLLQHGMELGGAAIGDVFPVPAIKSRIFGKMIGKAENAQGILTRGATKAVTPGTVGETLNTLEAQLDAGLLNTPQGIKDAKEVVDQVYMNPKIYERSPGINVQAARVSKKVQDLMNGPEIGPSLIPGRRIPAKAFVQANKIPNAIESAWDALPWAVKKGIQGAIGAGIGWKATGH